MRNRMGDDSDTPDSRFASVSREAMEGPSARRALPSSEKYWEQQRQRVVTRQMGHVRTCHRVDEQADEGYADCYPRFGESDCASLVELAGIRRF